MNSSNGRTQPDDFERNWMNPDDTLRVPTVQEAAHERPLFVPIKEVCRMLGISRSTVDRLVKEGEDLGDVKIRGRIMFDPCAVEEWARAKRSQRKIDRT